MESYLHKHDMQMRCHHKQIQRIRCQQSSHNFKRGRFSSLIDRFNTCQHGKTTRLCILSRYMNFQHGKWSFDNFQEWTILRKDHVVAVSDSVPTTLHHHQLFKASRLSLHSKRCATESCATRSTSSTFNYWKFDTASEWTILTFYISFKFRSIVALLLSYDDVCFTGLRPWILRDSY